MNLNNCQFRGSSNITIPKYVGAYEIGNTYHKFSFALTYKPNFIHRFFMKLLLDFRWIDYKNE